MNFSTIPIQFHKIVIDTFDRLANRKGNYDEGDTFPQAKKYHPEKSDLQASEERFRTSVEALLDGFAIFSSVRDASGRIIDFRYEYINEAGCMLNNRSREEHIGHTLLELFPAQQDFGLIQEYARVVETGQPLIKENLQYEDVYGGGNKLARAYDVRIVKLGDGFVIVWRDVTERKRIEESEREQRTLAEALQEIAISLNSTLEREAVLDNILEQLGRVVPYDSVNLMLIKNGDAQIVRSRGYEERGLQDIVLTHRLNVSETNNLRWMAETGKPMTIPDTWQSPDWVRLPKSEWIRSYAGAPLRVNGRTIGFLNVNSAQPGFYSNKYADRLLAFAVQSALAIENAELFREVQELALTDSVTGLRNRRGLLELGQQEMERSIRFRHSLSALMIDIDHFKNINDLFGHEGGDEVLRFLGNLLLNSTRKSDIVGRYGGEEFLILLSETELSSAIKAAERLRMSFSTLAIPVQDKKISCTISIGVSSLANGARDLHELIRQADQAMYEAKRAGRNRVALAASR